MLINSKQIVLLHRCLQGQW